MTSTQPAPQSPAPKSPAPKSPAPKSPASQRAARRPVSLRSALTRYRVLAYLTGVFLLLLTLHILIQTYEWKVDDLPWAEAKGLGTWIPGADTAVPTIHGWLYLVYVVFAIDLWLRTKLPVVRMSLVVLAGTVPFMSFLAERWVTGRVQPMIAAAQQAASQQAASQQAASQQAASQQAASQQAAVGEHPTPQ